ncbi:uncharacterized protein LOC132757012 isoform X2 [Ruditapes philippinarum]|uniref:uncharacterized protein LOC132757012 isoform X2 n=1 Tax=Ruditapes philippinarum TaxID=129788 RepID=UPI00295A575B|nr:uncharacterized protein LOC132757012 isoform X2 [Ruditapes philippinarum]
MDKHQGNRVTKVFRVCYTSLYALLISTILNEYCNAKNETTPGVQGNSSDLYRILDPSTWMNGYNSCMNIHNLTMASAYDISDISKLDTTFDIDDHLPVWIYAFEIVLVSGQIVRIQSNEVSKYYNSINCSNIHGEELFITNQSLVYAKEKCREDDKNLTLSKITPLSIDKFAQKIYINATIWANVLNITDFFNERNNLTVRCLLWELNGLRTEDCTKTHRTLCIQGNTQPVIQYVKQQKIREYKSSATTRLSSNIWMDLDVRYALIAVGSVICLVLCLIAVCCCCRIYRRKAENKRNSAHLVEGYSETADSIVMKETSVYETADTSEYAIPEDALKKARQRQSIGENEYDVLQKSNEMPKKYTGNAYNHVTIVPQKDRLGSSNQEENVYDVTNYGKQNSVIVSPKDLSGNIYGEVALKSKAIEKKQEKGS